MVGKPLLERLYLLHGRGEGLEAVEEDDRRAAHDLERLPHRLLGHAAGGDEHRLAGLGHRADELGVFHVGGVDLERVRPLLRRQRQRRLVEGLDEERQARGPGRLQQLAPLLGPQLDRVEVLPAGVAVHDELLGAEELELDPVRAHLERGLEHLQGGVDGAAVRGGDLGEDEARRSVPHRPGPQAHGGRVHAPNPTTPGRRAISRSRPTMRAVAPPSTPCATWRR